jgi:threonine dehydrogenase-like Zn-dependent dehydrogenase
VYAIQKRLPWDAKGVRHRVLVVGAGPVGLLAALVFSVHDFDMTVYSLEPDNDMRAELSRTLGANYVCGKTHDVAALGREIKGNLDVIFDGSGASKLAFQLFPLLGLNGIFVWTGIPGSKGTVDVDAGSIMRDLVLKNQDIVGSVNANRIDFENAIKSLGVLKQKVPSSDTLIKRFAPEDYADLLLNPPSTAVLKSVIQFSK